MMKLPCEIVQDLLPSYADGLTNDVTKEAVEDHLETCRDCRNVYERMTGGAAPAPDPAQSKEINFLKKKRKQTAWIVVGSILSALFLLVGGLFIGFFLVDREQSPESLAYTVTADDDYLYIHGYTMDSATAVTRVKQERDGDVLTLRCMGTLVGVYREDGFALTLPFDPDLREVHLGDRLIWKDGVFIEPKVSALYATRHDYVGDAAANVRTAEVLGLPGSFGTWENELQTETAPYGWTLRFKTATEVQDLERTRDALRANAYLMMAVIGNLDTVTFELHTERQVVNVTQTLTVTREEGDRETGINLREAGSDPVALQGLWNALDNRNAIPTVPTQQNAEDVIARIVVINDTDRTVMQMGIQTYCGNALGSSHWGMHADETPIQKGEAMYFDLTLQDLGFVTFPGFSDSSNPICFRFTWVDDADVAYELPEDPIPLQQSQVYFLQETEDGFVLAPVVGQN